MRRLVPALGLILLAWLLLPQASTIAQYAAYLDARRNLSDLTDAAAARANLGVSGALSTLASQAANTAVANVTSSTATPTAAALPSCADTGTNHLNYVSGTGFTCGTSGSTGTVTAVIAGSQLNIGVGPGGTITGTGTMNWVYPPTGLVYSSSTALSAATFTDGSIQLTAGDLHCASMTSGQLGCAKPGTGVNVSGSPSSLNIDVPVTVAHGGTGAVTAALARVGLNVGTASPSAASSTITPDCTASNVHTITLVTGTGPYTLANCSGAPVAGATFIFIITQPASGSTQTLATYGNMYLFATPYTNAAPPALTATLSAVDVLSCVAKSASVMLCTLTATYS